jgi:hypothetical protein
MQTTAFLFFILGLLSLACGVVLALNLAGLIGLDYIPLDKKNRMLRAGFGKYYGNWFVRIDLWFFGIRIT